MVSDGCNIFHGILSLFQNWLAAVCSGECPKIGLQMSQKEGGANSFSCFFHTPDIFVQNVHNTVCGEKKVCGEKITFNSKLYIFNFWWKLYIFVKSYYILVKIKVHFVVVVLKNQQQIWIVEKNAWKLKEERAIAHHSVKLIEFTITKIQKYESSKVHKYK